MTIERIKFSNQKLFFDYVLVGAAKIGLGIHHKINMFIILGIITILLSCTHYIFIQVRLTTLKSVRTLNHPFHNWFPFIYGAILCIGIAIIYYKRKNSKNKNKLGKKEIGKQKHSNEFIF